MPTAAARWPKGSAALATFVVVSVAALFAMAPARQAKGAKAGLALTAPLPDRVPPGVVLRVGDPVSRWVFHHNGWDEKLPFRIEWAEITGGPDVTEAFHAGALDVGFGASVPPIHAVWMGIPVRIVGYREYADRGNRQAYVFGIAPKAKIRTLADLRGKRIAFSPSQVQAQIVIQTLKAEGIARKDVTLVELPSSIGGDVYSNALAAGVVDAAPIRADLVARRYVGKFGSEGATLLKHPPFRDDGGGIYVPEAVLNDPGKAAALCVFVHYWGLSQAWISTHKAELASGYYAKDQGLSPEDARVMAEYASNIAVPRSWGGAIAYEQAAVDTLAPETKHPRFDAATLFDPRFQTIAGDAAATAQGQQP
ncbi:ABC transporter substrate-binding protein [Novosphingobium sp. 9U]|uniref:ABC transporter substrate-binding protein n=1 Tax=Novosphingobium sp. 9U TaxID=2653158 RepID=UPI0012F0592B|nr:ABC transporter substrate-binding protein [Novosphingobium sp. 9U]VWX55069.1 Sulfonate transport system substrate-binding protein [Novosphingobium sp. 9U]